MEKQKFWTVWSPRGGRAKVRHASFEESRDEAARLSAKFPGRHFYVMEMVGYSIVGDETLTRKQRKALRKFNEAQEVEPTLNTPTFDSDKLREHIQGQPGTVEP